MFLFAFLFMVYKKFYQETWVLIFAGIWFFICIAPTNSFIPRTELLSERNLYLPSVGICIFLGFFLYMSIYSSPVKKVVGLPVKMIALIFILSSFFVLTIHRNRDYYTEISLWADAFEKNLHHLETGKTSGLKYLMAGQNDKAFLVFKKVHLLNPNRYDSNVNLGIAYTKLGSYAKAEESLKMAIRLRDDMPESYVNLGYLYATQNRIAESLDQFEKADTIFRRISQPAPPGFFKTKAILHNKMGILYDQSNNPDAALTEFQKALSLNSIPPHELYDRGLFYLNQMPNSDPTKHHLRRSLFKVSAPE